MWNIHIGSIIRKDLLRIRKTLDNMETFLRSGAAGSRTFEKRPDRLVIRFNNPESARSAEGAAGDMLLGEKHLRIIRADRDLDIGVVPYTKGLAVSELASHIGISPREILTIGNGYNDLSMLNENVAFSTGCPLNSEPEVIERVHRIGGHISREESIVGTIDVIKAYISRKIDSSLPDGWIENAAEQSAISHYKRRSSQSRRRHHRPCFNIWLFLLTAYTVLAVFASYGFVPFSRIIMLPIKMIVVAVERILRLF